LNQEFIKFATIESQNGEEFPPIKRQQLKKIQ